jgi:uncharacterized protein YndB with AHSA1/START domain
MTISVKKTGPMSQELTMTTVLAPEAVYDYLSDFDKHHEWVEDIVDMDTTNAAEGVGRSFKTTEAMKGMKGDTFAEITALQRPRYIEWRARTAANHGPFAMRSRWSFIIEPEGSGSRVTQTQTMEPANIFAKGFGSIFVPLADGLLGGMGASPKNVRRHFEKLKEILDAMAASGGGATGS